MSGYAVSPSSAGTGAGGSSASIPSSFELEALNNILAELQAQSAMQAQAFDLYDGPEGYRTTNQVAVTPSPSP